MLIFWRNKCFFDGVAAKESLDYVKILVENGADLDIATLPRPSEISEKKWST